MSDALCIGHAAWDVSLWVPDYPAENSKCEIREMVECSGGPAANAACLLARWGVPTAFLGAVGHDGPGDQIMSSLAGCGVETALVSRFADWPTPVSVITVSERNGSRTIVNRRAADVARGRLPVAQAAGRAAPRLLLFDGHELEASLDAMERWPDALTVLDAGSLRPGTQTLTSRVQYLAASERFAAQLLGLENLRSRDTWSQAIAVLHQLNGNPVVITLGERGLIAGSGTDWFHLPAFPSEPVDTTGAGDIFHGALAYALLQGMENHDGLRLASAAAAMSVSKRGSSTSIPTLAEVRTFLQAAPELAATSGADIILG